MDDLVLAVEQVRLPHDEEQPADARDDQGPYYDRAGPLPHKRGALLDGKDEEDRGDDEQRVSDKVDLGEAGPRVVPVSPLFGPEQMDSEHGQDAEGDAVARG